MFNITILCRCKICQSEVVISSHAHKGHYIYSTHGNEKNIPFVAYHHEGFSSSYGGVYGSCDKCGARYTIRSDIISIICNPKYLKNKINFDAIEDESIICKNMTFPKWLKKQISRDDRVGDIARDAYAWDKFPRERKKQLESEYQSRPQRAEHYTSWIKFLKQNKQALISFRMAWAEYEFLRHYLEGKD